MGQYNTMVMFPKVITKKESQYERLLRYRKNSVERARRHVKAKKVRKARRVKLPSIRSLKLKADKLFGAYIRNRDGNKCVLCGSTRNPNCGHLIKRGKLATRWDEINCSCLCSGCNYKDNFEHDHYVLYFLREYGQPMYEDLLERSKRVVKLNRQMLNEIITKYIQ